MDKIKKSLDVEHVTLNKHGQAVIAKKAEVNMNTCGHQCEALTQIANLRPCRDSWTLKGHLLQEQMINYVLDVSKPVNELIVKEGSVCLTRDRPESLGLQRNMDSFVGDACLDVVRSMAQNQGKTIFISTLHIPPTWLPPAHYDPLISLPNGSTNFSPWYF
ncbi:hypothetical protein G5714_004431 [Onychostoma macrolepis]|uniref:Uncharacterized protein n=1 Tax=Onychostoma macrolepis TaxID=369639 RepID=A0A7J6D4P3_9TELE|nr:hypothetical protein G5714_004431 [Onychostoma macrolepis]